MSCTFLVTLVILADVFEEYYNYFCDNYGPLPYVIISALYSKHSLLNRRLKFMKMTECCQNYRLYRTIISNYSIEVE